MTTFTATATDEAGCEFLRGFVEISKRHDQRLADLGQHLRSRGVVALHPLDGWVRRVGDGVVRFQLVYPRFQQLDRMAPGALVAFDDHETVYIYEIEHKVKSVFVDDKWQARFKETIKWPR